MNYCQKGFEKCTIRPSVHTFVSMLVFFYAEYVLINSLIKQGPVIGKLVTGPLPEFIQKQFTTIFVIFCSVFYIHFLRIYLSLLLMEKDVSFYKRVFKHIEKRALIKYFEWLLRLVVLGSLVFFVSYGSDRRVERGEFFVPIFRLYLFLLAWDVLMLIFVCKKDERLGWLVNDILGFLIALSFVLLEFQIYIVSRDNVLFFVLGMGLSGLISFVLLVYNILQNFTRYLQYSIEELFPFKKIECEGLQCTAND